MLTYVVPDSLLQVVPAIPLDTTSYCDFRMLSTTSNVKVGVALRSVELERSFYSNRQEHKVWHYFSDGDICQGDHVETKSVLRPPGYDISDVVRVEVDRRSHVVRFYKNGRLAGEIAGIPAGQELFFAICVDNTDQCVQLAGPPRPPPPRDEQGVPPQLELKIGTRADLSSVKVTTVAPTAKTWGSVLVTKVEKSPDFSVVYGAQPLAAGAIKFKIRAMAGQLQVGLAAHTDHRSRSFEQPTVHTIYYYCSSGRFMSGSTVLVAGLPKLKRSDVLKFTLGRSAMPPFFELVVHRNGREVVRHDGISACPLFPVR